MAVEEIYIKGATLVQITNLENAETGAKIDDATVKMSLYKESALAPEQSEIAFTSGGVAEPAVGDILKGATGGATARLDAIVLDTGTWAGGDAEGRLELSRQMGTFEAENLNQVDGQDNIATIAGDSSGAITVDAGAKTKIHVRNHNLSTAHYVRIQGSINQDGEHAITAVIEDYITIDNAFVAEKFTGNEAIYIGVINGIDISLAHEGGDADGYYDGALPDTLVGLINDSHYFRFISVVKAATKALVRQRCRAVYYLDED